MTTGGFSDVVLLILKMLSSKCVSSRNDVLSRSCVSGEFGPFPRLQTHPRAPAGASWR